jgi:hypothetical protein
MLFFPLHFEIVPKTEVLEQLPVETGNFQTPWTKDFSTFILDLCGATGA